MPACYDEYMKTIQTRTPEEKIITRDQFAALVRTTATTFGMAIPNFHDGDRAVIAYSSNDSWGCEATVDVSDYFEDCIKIDSNSSEELSRIEITIGWSSTYRSIADSIAAIAAYNRAVQFAAAIEAEIKSKFFVKVSSN